MTRRISSFLLLLVLGFSWYLRIVTSENKAAGRNEPFFQLRFGRYFFTTPLAADKRRPGVMANKIRGRRIGWAFFFGGQRYVSIGRLL